MASTVVDTPIGPLGLVASDSALQSVWFDGARIRPDGSSAVLDEAERQLDAYFGGELVAFDLPLELNGTQFQRGCWLPPPPRPPPGTPRPRAPGPPRPPAG